MADQTAGTSGSASSHVSIAAAVLTPVLRARVKKVTKDVLRCTIGRVGDTLLPPPKKLVIFTRGRTGSNFLVGLLKSHPRIRHHGEIFGEYYLNNDFVKREINKIGPVIYFDRTTRRMMNELVVGAKFLYYQLESAYAERWKVHNIPEILPALRARTDLRIIHLKRRNKLATFVSRKLARQSSKYVGGPYGIKTVALDFQECLDEFLQTERWESWYDSAFRSHPFVTMYYEDLVTNPETEMQRVLDLIELDPRVLYSPMRKQNARRFHDLIENYSELKAQFAGTPYAEFFTE